MSHSLRRTFIPFHEWEGVGGPYTFMGNLKRELDRRQIALCPTYLDCDQMLFPISYDLDKLHWGKVRGKRFIVRLDGIYYPEKHGSDYRQLNQPIKEIYRYYADLVIFQSDYCRRQCFALFGEKPESEYRIIHNGADFDLFHPAEGDRQLGDQVQFITTGNFRDAAMIQPVVEALDQLASEKSFRLQVVGPVEENLQCWIQRDYIDHLGTKSVTETADLLRKADIFIYSHLNPPCPNSVIEAVTTAIPVVGFDSGAMSELLPWSRQLLADVSDRTFQRREDLSADRLREKLDLAVREYPTFEKLALQHAKDYPFIHCCDQYLDAINHIGSQAKPEPASRTAGWVHGRLGTLATKLAKRLKLDGPIRAAAVELLASSRREEFSDFMMRALRHRFDHQAPSEALKTAFDFDKRVYEMEGEQAIKYDDGVHTKHRHMQYHKFFTSNVKPTDRVLDLGCGKGELANSIAGVVTEGCVYGIDYRQESIDRATNAFGRHRDNLTFVHGDITKDLPGQAFDVVVLSNVLEHIDERVALLKQCIELFSPRQILIRVPMYQRDWRVPLMDELGFDYRLDPEHYIEFSPETFAAEMDEAGLKVAHAEYRWGEIWSRLEPK